MVGRTAVKIVPLAWRGPCSKMGCWHSASRTHRHTVTQQGKERGGGHSGITISLGQTCDDDVKCNEREARDNAHDAEIDPGEETEDERKQNRMIAGGEMRGFKFARAQRREGEETRKNARSRIEVGCGRALQSKLARCMGLPLPKKVCSHSTSAAHLHMQPGQGKGGGGVHT